jgi:hypothetical protein
MMMNVEKIYWVLNVCCFPMGILYMISFFLGEVSLWIPIVIWLFPTALLLIVVGLALLWSFYITKDTNY